MPRAAMRMLPAARAVSPAVGTALPIVRKATGIAGPARAAPVTGSWWKPQASPQRLSVVTLSALQAVATSAEPWALP
jgi:hypothetical protein